jgi:hypothetical protein
MPCRGFVKGSQNRTEVRPDPRCGLDNGKSPSRVGLGLANWATACCGSKVPRGAMPSITTLLSHGYGRVVRSPRRQADYRLAMRAAEGTRLPMARVIRP